VCANISNKNSIEKRKMAKSEEENNLDPSEETTNLVSRRKPSGTSKEPSDAL
jgi:hypothetical protein